MTIPELLNKYQLHDSTLEDIRFPDTHSVELIIDVCLWMQDNYQGAEPETQIQHFIFEKVISCEYDEYSIDSDSILEARLLSEQTLELVVLSETDGDCHIIRICAQCVHISI